jgi:1-acyl-sn-glycerol-3-phosphate acyltransferase
MTSDAQPPSTRLTPIQVLLKWLARAAFRVAARVRVEGLERFPPDGPYIVAINHLHVFDVVLAFATVPHAFAGLAGAHWQKRRFAWWLCGKAAHLIPVHRDRLDPRTVAEADRWLRQGGVLLVAPEGTRSRNAALIRGQPGVAYLAARSEAQVIPLVAWGQEHWLAEWAHMRRPTIHIRVGEPLFLTDLGPRPRGDTLSAGTDRIMMALAALLPPEYHGVYTDGPPG